MNDHHANGFRAVIFDLDGTLLDTLADIGDSVNLMLTEYGFPGHTTDDYRRFIGNGIQMLVTRALPIEGRSEEMVDACVRRARELYWENWNRKTRPYEGITDLLDQLKTRDLPLAVLSNKPHDFTVRYVNAYFGAFDFKVIMGQNIISRSSLTRRGRWTSPGGSAWPGNISLCGGQCRGYEDGCGCGHACRGCCLGIQRPKELTENGMSNVGEPSEGDHCAVGATINRIC